MGNKLRAKFGQRVTFANKCDVEIRKVTPKDALELLELNIETNRKLSKRDVDRYARDMVAGQWIFAGNTIVFNKHGNLINGQHRLTAVVESGETQVFLIVHVRDDAAFSACDIGRTRTHGDILGIEGFSNASLLGGVANMVNRIGLHFVGSKNLLTIPKTQVGQYVKDHPELVNSAEFAASIKSKLTGWLSPSVVGGVHYYWSRASQGRAEEIFTRMASDERDERGQKDPAYVLRQKLRTARMNRRSFAEQDVIYMLQRVWDLEEGREPANKSTFQLHRDRSTVFVVGSEDTLGGLLDRAGTTQAWLAECLGVHQSTVSNWVQGDSRPDRRMVSRALRLLRTRIQEAEAAKKNNKTKVGVGEA
jgi:hypothetical protein